MHWLLDMPHGLAAAVILGAFATVVLFGVTRWSAAAATALAIAAPIAAALPAVLQPTDESFPTLLVLAATLGCALLLRGDDLADPRHRIECIALQLLGAAGACALATADDWLNLLIGFESMSLAVAVLAGVGRGTRALEVAFRFFVLSTVAAATMVYGIGLHAFATGSFALGAQPLEGTGLAAMATAGVILAALGLAFELAVVPAHLGTLGICFAAPLGCATFAMTVSKVAAALAMVRLATAYPSVQPVLLGLSTLTIVWATFGGLAQKHLRGLLAYSAIAHGGFLALAAGCGAAGRGALCYYALVYVASVALVLAALAGGEGDVPLAELSGRPRGRMRRAALVVGLMSLAGVPPTPGFLAKLAVLRCSWDAGPAFTVVAALGAVFSVMFYLRPVPDLLAGLSTDGGRGLTPVGARVAIGVAAAVALVCAVLPQLAVRLAS